MKTDEYGYACDEDLEFMSKEWLLLYVKTLKKDIKELNEELSRILKKVEGE